MSSDAPALNAPRGDDYWVQARQPLHSLLFLAPLLVAYEAGVLWFARGRDESLRNGADFWMRGWLQQTGLANPWMLPALVVGLLLAWQIAGKYKWRVSTGTLAGMTAESLLFGCCLIVVGQLQDLAFRHVKMSLPLLNIPMSQSASTIPKAVSYLGAGVYEEVLFRLCLLPLGYGVFRLFAMPKKPALVLAVIATSLIFSAAHYIGPAADQFSPYSFTFRALAGGFFALLFVLRGFGVTVGAHAAYDLIVGVIMPAHWA